MGGIVRRALLGIAVVLGLAEPAEPPVLQPQLYRLGNEVYADVELAGFPGSKLEQLIESGNAIALTVTVRSPAGESTAEKILSCDGIRFTVADSGSVEPLTTESESAAYILAGVFTGLFVPGLTAESEFPVRVVFQSRIRLVAEPDAAPPDADVMMLWGYKPALTVRELYSIREIPY